MNELTPLEVWSLVKKYMNIYHKQVVNADVESVEGHPISIIETELKDAEKYKKAVKIIKENLVVSYDESKNDKPCLILGVKVDKDKLVIIYETFDKEEIDLLKEVLK